MEENTSILTHMADQVLKPGDAYQLAINYTSDPYYEKATDEDEPYILRSKHKQSTNEFYTYVTLYVTTKDWQLTLVAYPVRQGTSKVGYIARCPDRITELGLKIEVLCLDRGSSTPRMCLGF